MREPSSIPPNARSRNVRGIRTWVGRWWRGDAGVAGGALSLATLPAEALYRFAVGVRGAAWERGLWREGEAPLPVVSVGNLVVGGTGKTPVTSWVARRLEARGGRPAILLRGYGRDEVLLHRRWTPDVAVLAGADRLLSAGLAARDGATVAVLDDGFQHRRLARDLDIVLVAAEHPFPGRMLPRGPYRESTRALERADMVVVTRRTAPDRAVDELLGRLERFAPGRTGTVLGLAPSGWATIAGEEAAPPSGPLLAATAVAGPELFREGLERLVGEPVSLMGFPDHHEFDGADVRRIVREAGERVVVVTEKDAVKLEPLGGLPPSARVLRLSVIAERGAEALERALATVVALARPAANVSDERGPTAGERKATTTQRREGR